MKHIHTLRRVLVALACLGLSAASISTGGARADDVGERPEPRRYDYSRFSDGPRRVPTPRGASLRRAEALGLGRFRTANLLLSEPPAGRWVEAARGGALEGLHWPVDGGRFGRGFGFTRRERRDLRHDGIDIVAPEGAVVRAVADGIVAYSDNGIRGFGNCVLVVHPNGWVSLYAHNSRNTVQAGWRVHKGERIGFVGATGIARGPHLHFELRERGRPIDAAHLFERESRVSTPAPGPRADASPADLGTIETARRLIRGDVDEALAARAGRVFSNLLWPARGGRLERGFEDGHHRGLDVGAEAGTAVRAAADGLVVYVGDELPGLGESVVLLHRNGWVTVYGSNDDVAVEVGQTVQRGEWIALVGESGAAEGAHLHFELHDRGAPRDPTGLLVQVPSE